MSARTAPRVASRLLVVGDVGGWSTYHVGDESMLEANLTRLRRWLPELSCTVLSSDPEWTKEQYGVDALPPVGFPKAGAASDEERERRLAAVLDAGRRWSQDRGSASGDPAERVVRAVQEADAVLVSGGGNLSDSWPEHVYERVAILHLARIFGKPSVVTGQTLGPGLADARRQRLAAALAEAELIGLRELHSLRFALELPLPPQRLSYQLDDAFFLEPLPPDGDPQLEELVADPRPWMAVTVHPVAARGDLTAALSPVARQLREVLHATGLRMVFVPHVAGTAADAEEGDLAAGRALESLVGPESVTVLDCRSARRVRWVTGRAALVVSTRYHPLVFALSAGVPALGLPVDEYTRIKLQGALEHAGLGGWVLPLEDARAGRLAAALSALWERRDVLRRWLTMQRARWRLLDHVHWARVIAALGGVASAPPPEAAALETGPPMLSGAELLLTDERQRLSARAEEAARYARSLEAVLRAREEELDMAKQLIQDHEHQFEAAARYARSLEEAIGRDR